MFRLFFNYFAFGARARVRLPISIPTEPFLAWSFIGRMVLRRVAARSEHNFHWQEESPRLPLRSTPDEFGSIGPASRTGPAANAQAYHISASSGPTNFRQKPETRPVLEHGNRTVHPAPAPIREIPRLHLQTCGVALGPVCGPRCLQLHIIHAQR